MGHQQQKDRVSVWITCACHAPLMALELLTWVRNNLGYSVCFQSKFLVPDPLGIPLGPPEIGVGLKTLKMRMVSSQAQNGPKLRNNPRSVG
mmetsp:Transcript_50232/g.89663  ORF Transcript_50232/g.89663 Transcript_50232/m.89663 type:complete len:91 (-) Transcript_50232:606-878(-)